MKLLSISLALSAMLTLSRAVPINSTISRQWGLCEYRKEHSHHLIGEYVPQCDMNGNFLPQQCDGSTGYCWCADVFTGVEIPNTSTGPGVTPVNCEAVFPCPVGWSYFDRTCFIFHYAYKTWIEAEAFCLFEGANLASIHSYEENNFVQSLTQIYTEFPQTWIGGQDAVQPSFWMWSDGSRFNYENWFEEPVLQRNENCLKMNYGLEWNWKQAGCNETHPFVCSKRI